MKRRHLPALIGLLLAGLLVPAGASVSAQAQTGSPTLVAIRAAHHPGFDRVVFEFRGALPRVSVRYVGQVIGDASGLPVPVAGNAFLRVVMKPATGHNDAGQVTYGPTRRTYALPNVMQVVNAGDFEGVLTFGIGLAKHEPVSVSLRSRPSRVVVDVATPFRTVPAKVYFVDSHNFATGKEPYVRAVTRPVIPPAVGTAALQRLFAGPTQAELARGLRLVTSGATGTTGLSVRDQVARVRLTGKCSSGGSTLTVASLIMPTLKQFPTVRWVKIYDPSGHTETPYGHSDSIPFCLEP